jgi:hypothetical protein
MSDQVTSIVRTLSILIAGWVATTLADVGFGLDSEALASVIFGVAAGLYYLVARLLERRFPNAGLLLGSRNQPTYK